MEKVQFLFFSNFLLVLRKFSLWEKYWALAYNSMKFYDFPDFFYFSKSLCLNLSTNYKVTSYIPFLLLITISWLWWKKKNTKISKSLKILWPWHSVKNSHIFAGMHFVFLIKRPKPSLKAFQNHILTSVKGSGK